MTTCYLARIVKKDVVGLGCPESERKGVHHAEEADYQAIHSQTGHCSQSRSHHEEKEEEAFWPHGSKEDEV